MKNWPIKFNNTKKSFKFFKFFLLKSIIFYWLLKILPKNTAKSNTKKNIKNCQGHTRKFTTQCQRCLRKTNTKKFITVPKVSKNKHQRIHHTTPKMFKNKHQRIYYSAESAQGQMPKNSPHNT